MRVACSVSALCANRLPRSTWRSSSSSRSGTVATLSRPPVTSTAVHDIVVFGATGFVGRLVAEYLDKADADVALAGRSREKLEALGIDRPLIVADADDPGALARSARVVARRSARTAAAG